MAISDSGYKYMAEQVYNVEPSKAKSNDADVIVEGGTITDDKTAQSFKVLSVQDNNNDVDTTNTNGMQAMAVAPIVNGKVDTTQVIIAYAGTNDADQRDIDTDIQMVIGGDTSKLSTDTKTVRVGSSTSEFMLYYKGVRNVSSFIA